MYNDILIHRGVAHDDNPPGRGSGRYSYGSGENPFQHQFTFLSEVKSLRDNGMKDAEIAKALLGDRATTTHLKAEISIARTKERQANTARALKLYDECNGNVSEVARRMSNNVKTWNESTIRSLLNPAIAERTSKYENTAKVLKDAVDKKGLIDVGKDVGLHLGVTEHTKDVAVAMLEKEGYVKAKVKIPQMTTNHETTMNVLAPPGTTYGEIVKNRYNIQSVVEFTPDKGTTWWTPEFPKSIDSSRIKIRYAEEGGKDKDGVIEIRPGVEDISLGGAKYAQVRIAVDGTNYMKGMAVYSDDIPKGYDIVYNSNKHVGTPAIDTSAEYVFRPETGEYGWTGKEVLKRMKIDEKTMEVDKDNPFGALIKSPKDRDGVISAAGQRHYIDSDGKEQLSVINKLQDEGDWDSWSRTLSSQFLSKQPLKLINQQIDLSLADKRADLDEIKSLTNPVIKKKLLDDFANRCDANAADLSVKGFKNQAFQVILPITSLKDNECYAPNFNDGDTVALVRYPHAGTFEIPVLKVNNKHAGAKKVMEGATDAIGINSKVAERLSGADFDGDTALVIPMASNRISIKSTDPLPGLVDFDPKEIYKLPDTAPRMKNNTKQIQMGIVSNLITDMTVGGANYSELERAVKHSMVVIDAEKHHLDYKQSEKDNRINDLKKLYQGVSEKTGQAKGASTILSKAKSEGYINERKEVTDTGKMTDSELERWNEGKKVYRDTGRTKKKLIKDPSKMTEAELKLYNSGKKVYRDSTELVQTKAHKMDLVDDATDLVRDKTNKKEMAYARYANGLKDMANEARREYRSIRPTPVNSEAKKTYATEVAQLEADLRIAKMNSAKERRAQGLANAMVSEKLKSNPGMDYEHQKREESLAITRARSIVGAKKKKIEITDKEWEAIQANAISTSKLTEILNNTDQEAFKKRATPRKLGTALTASQLGRIKAMSATGMYTQKEIADALGISASAVSKAIRNS